MRRIVTNVLTKGGIDVIGAAKDGDEALALCERETPDAMTLDLAMPGLGGIDVLKALKQRGGPAIPVVVVSAFSPAHGAYAVDALAEGAFELVPKPSGSGRGQRVRAEPAHQDPRRHQDAPPRRSPAIRARAPQRHGARPGGADRLPPTATRRPRAPAGSAAASPARC